MLRFHFALNFSFLEMDKPFCHENSIDIHSVQITAFTIWACEAIFDESNRLFAIAELEFLRLI